MKPIPLHCVYIWYIRNVARDTKRDLEKVNLLGGRNKDRTPRILTQE